MSSLWKMHPKLNKKKGTAKQAPSLYQTKNSNAPLQGATPTQQKLFAKQSSHTMERTSPRTFFVKKIVASMTVEASLVLPLFLLFFLNLGGGLELMRFHGRMQTALWEIGRETCIYGAALQKGLTAKTGAGEDGAQIRNAVGNLAFSYTYVKGRVEESLGKEYLKSAPISNAGLTYLGGSILNGDGLVSMVVSYAAQPKWTVRGYRRFWMENHYYGRAWTGYELKDGDNALYYLTENAEVYHVSLECSHLKLQPTCILSSELSKARNAKGSRYRACSMCNDGPMPVEVWISPEGACYHLRRDCPGLKRTIRAVTWDEAKKYRPCSRCGKGQAN